MQSEQLRKIGIALGYPECCVAYFVEKYPGPWHQRNEPEAWDSTGFIPCPDCRPKCVHPVDFALFVELRIAPNRKVDIPFPECVIYSGEVETWTEGD